MNSHNLRSSYLIYAWRVPSSSRRLPSMTRVKTSSNEVCVSGVGGWGGVNGEGAGQTTARTNVCEPNAAPATCPCLPVRAPTRCSPPRWRCAPWQRRRSTASDPERRWQIISSTEGNKYKVKQEARPAKKASTATCLEFKLEGGGSVDARHHKGTRHKFLHHRHHAVKVAFFVSNLTRGRDGHAIVNGPRQEPPPL